ncbi:G/U mismatch-specific uracil-DNA glycosylase [Desulfofundulus australicus DSM 11792]|uniref:G/U mismatch-specific uracil-DNA glycosylase n=1 Tax=Desulfofundulus australicus DSM 11792 TaxID=1121425 RepID=A0A1M5E3N0_9FIRM|nr:mismatch-specific DNA-glycosylase [Desulfofundulus australicus]SHF73672.1 G/U mismatch-specific uracil-DNA glycosylase [Desulfofundulus australicus DSM 11792]
MDILPDVLKPGLKVVFCGTAAGNRSATIGAYYAGRGNQFWAVLYRIGLTPRQLQPQEYRSLLSYGIGLTDLVKRVSGNDNTLEKEFFDIGGFRQRLVKAAPKAVAFNGKRAAMEFLGRHVKYGLQPERVGSSAVFVLPSTSGAARAYWIEQYWLELAEYVGRYDNRGTTQVLSMS